MTIPFSDLQYLNEGALEDFAEDLQAICASGEFVLGPRVQKFEEAFAKFIGNRACVSLGSGTDALMLGLRSLGVGPGDEVIVPAFAFPSTANAVARLGATPVFVDVRAETYNLDPDKTLASITSRTKAIIPVHLFGQAVEIDRLVNVARTYTVHVVEDVRLATGAKIGSRRIGTYGELGAFSFNPETSLGCLGDGGALTTNNEERAALIRKLRDQGVGAEGDCEMVGYNSRLDAIQAAFLQHKMADLDDDNDSRIENAKYYDRLLMGSPAKTPTFYDDGQAIYTSYVVRAPEREKLAEKLEAAGIGFRVPIARPLHLQPAFAYLGYREGAFPIAEECARECIALPVRPGLKKKEIEQVAEVVTQFYGARA